MKIKIKIKKSSLSFYQKKFWFVFRTNYFFYLPRLRKKEAT